ncbi:hypothetical protein GA0074692_0861 [Micromonospora pallida]|uniref:Uncharacterized protein n=1 Tax=Micromonospora pallida TaxID=145854 RepID=A0A1C6RT85_9ACTN|nr:hypothetical protein [Micromonospora pallida]SCL20413.1 hypothetical protein GA0074692_0861 [Micromonospora pallida]
MTFHTETTLAGYARAAVHLKGRMVDYGRTSFARQYLRAYLDAAFEGSDATTTPEVLDAVDRLTHQPWQLGEPYVLAPEMSAVVAAAEALNLTGDVVPDDVAPSDGGVLFLPEPIYHRGLHGQVTSIGAVTWAKMRNRATGSTDWWIIGWADRDDPLDPSAARRRSLYAEQPQLAAELGPYVLTSSARLPIGRPVQDRPGPPVVDDDDIEWEPAPDGRFCIDESTVRVNAVAAIAYAFWVIQAQPLATVSAAPLDRAARRRAQRDNVVHETRVVMLRRRKAITDRDGGEARWHYRVRFFVKGHWRHLVNADGQPYRIWIHRHIKGPDGAPLLLGDAVSILAR